METDDIDLLITGFNGDRESDMIYHQLQDSMFSDVPVAYYKHLCGEYHTSSAFASWLAAMILKTQQCPEYIMKTGNAPSPVKNILIYNQDKNTNHSLILLSAC